jgi:hypothetical protein
MQERVEQLDGELKITTSDAGTTIVAEVPLSHLLAPSERSKTGSPPKTLHEPVHQTVHQTAQEKDMT